ncbi:hypothetical protein B0I35DRAFT_453115 [Stachybotrys elegans]|uniref:Alkaline foam protein B n=1 Tax=Stachybotrys elegans TaxID=80388 RepID=A0A8K0SIY5_9HYPO|nr:hypothetical protein B0I35DRAFT_453115 [Stachybotrys elegans]
MKFSMITAAAILGLASAQQAIVINGCKETVYVQSVPFDGSKSGSLTTLAPGKSFTEEFRKGGSTVKIAKNKNLDKPLFFGYSSSFNPDYSYYELSSEWGNPFLGSHNSLSAGPNCPMFDCKANDAACYSTPQHERNLGCKKPARVTAHLCK